MKRTAEQMYEYIRKWEMDAGESFLDYFDGSLNEANLLFWAMGKGYITEEGFKAWENEGSSVSGDDIVYGEEPYSIVKWDNGEWVEEDYEKAMKILAEFLASTDTYQERVDQFLTRIYKIKLEDVARELYRREKVFVNTKEKRIYASLDEVMPIPLGKLLSMQWFRDDSREED